MKVQKHHDFKPQHMPCWCMQPMHAVQFSMAAAADAGAVSLSMPKYRKHEQLSMASSMVTRALHLCAERMHVCVHPVCDPAAAKPTL